MAIVIKMFKNCIKFEISTDVTWLFFFQLKRRTIGSFTHLFNEILYPYDLLFTLRGALSKWINRKTQIYINQLNSSSDIEKSM